MYSVYLRFTFFFIVLSLYSILLHGQCCSGGSGSPIAGGASQGVLPERQMELNTNIQFINTDKFFTGDSPDTLKYFDGFKSTYEYFRLAYGVTKNLTMSVESGYFFQKKETGRKKNPLTTYSSKGVGDLILFPRFDIINLTEETKRTELTLGIGMKIPLGSYNDSAGNIEPFSGKTFYVTKPQSVQLSSGAQDFIFYLFAFRGYPLKDFRIFANALYIRKGWNPIGEKLGDFASVGLFASKTVFKNAGVTLQVRGERVGKMKLNEDILLYAYPNYDPEATGYKKVFIAPQVSYSIGQFTFYGLTEFPVYQKVVKTQIGSKHLTTIGMSYRFFVTGVSANKKKGEAKYFCPMHPELQSARPDVCPKCGMQLEKIKDSKQ